MKISWIGPWVSRIDWCKLHWCSCCEAVQCKGKNSLKTQKMHFLPVFELTSTIYIDGVHQFPLHQSILLTQGPIHEIFTKSVENWRFWKMAILKNSRFDFFFFFQKIFFCLIPMKICQKLFDRMDGTTTQFWCFHLFSANSSLCVILRIQCILQTATLLLMNFQHPASKTTNKFEKESFQNKKIYSSFRSVEAINFKNVN